MRLRSPLVVSIYAAGLSAACSPSSAPVAERQSALVVPAYAQGAAAVPQSPQSSVTVGLPRAQTAGNLLVVLAGWNDTAASVTSVSDALGDTFALAIGPTRLAGALSQSIYYAKSVLKGPNAVTVRFSEPAMYADIRVLEYAGIDRVAPFDVAAGASGSGATASTGTLTTRAAGELLVSGDMVLTGTPQAGNGYTARIITSPDGDIAQDRIVGAPGSASATAPVQAPNGWVIQVAAFKAAAGPADGGAGGSAGSGGTGGSASSGGNGGTGGAAGAGGSGGTGGAAGVGGSGTGGGGSGPCQTFPVHASADGRYLVTACGSPFLVAGDSPQCFTANLSPANMDAYLAARAGQGFNAVWMNLLCTTYTGGRADASTYDGIVPFAGGTSDVTHPNAAYFTRVDAAVSAAAAHGMVIFLDPIETGGFIYAMRSAGSAALRSYGQFLGARYANAPNIIWMHGNDFKPFNDPDDPLVLAVAHGLQDGGARQPQTVELDWPVMPSTLDDSSWQPPLAGVNLSYTYNPTYALMLRDYNRSPHLPNVMIEGNYEGENVEKGPHLTNAHDVRAQGYWTNLSGATGVFYGNHWEVYGLDNAGWQSQMAGDRGAPQMAHVKALFEARPWWQLVPDQSHAVVTSGRGGCMLSSDAQSTSAPNAQDNTCATTARTPDGKLVMTYLPTPRTITVEMSKLSGPATARWFDPTTGVFTAIAGSPLANSGSRTFTPPAGAHADGYGDWVLVLEAP